MTTVAKALLNYEGKILILRRSATHPFYAHQHDLPGGEVDKDKTPIQGVSREIREETGLRIAQSALCLVYERQLDSGDVHLLYEATIQPPKPAIKLSWEHDQRSWIGRGALVAESFPANLDPYFSDVITYLKAAS